jgi:hypothetical protein
VCPGWVIVAVGLVVSHDGQSHDLGHGPRGPASRYYDYCAKVQVHYSMVAQSSEVLPRHVRQTHDRVHRAERKVRLMAALLLGHVADHQVIWGL